MNEPAGVDLVTEHRIGGDYMADIAIPQARLVVEIKRRRDHQSVRQAQDQMDRLARIGWTGIIVNAGEVDVSAVVRQIEERL